MFYICTNTQIYLIIQIHTYLCNCVCANFRRKKSNKKLTTFSGHLSFCTHIQPWRIKYSHKEISWTAEYFVKEPIQDIKISYKVVTEY